MGFRAVSVGIYPDKPFYSGKAVTYQGLGSMRRETDTKDLTICAMNLDNTVYLVLQDEAVG